MRPRVETIHHDPTPTLLVTSSTIRHVFDDIVTNEQFRSAPKDPRLLRRILLDDQLLASAGEGTHTVTGKTVVVNRRELKKNCICA